MRSIDTGKWIFDLNIGDRFMWHGREVEVVSPWDYNGLPYGLGRILMNNKRLNPNHVQVVDTHDRSAIYTIKDNSVVNAY